MATTVTVGSVTAAISAAVGTVLNVVYKVILKPLFIVLKFVFFFLEFIFSNLAQIFIFNVVYFRDNLLGNPLGPKITKPKPTDEIFYFLQAIVDEIKDLTKEILKQLLILIIIIILSFISIGIAIVLIYLLQFIYPYIFKILNYVNIFLNFYAQLVAIGLNLGSESLQLFAPAWNDFITALEGVLRQLLALICTGTTTLTPSSNFAESCPVLNEFVFWLLGVFNEVVDFFATLGNSINDSYLNIGDNACFGGNCPASLCQFFGLDSACRFSPKLAVEYLNDLIQFIIKYVVPIAQGLIYFLLDTIIFFMGAITNVISVNNTSFEAFLRNRIENPGPSLVSTLQDGFLKRVLVLMQNYFLGSLGVALDTIRIVSVLTDTVICNLFLGFIDCAVPKMCYAILKPFNITIPKLFSITIDLGTTICQESLGLPRYASYCKCNQCLYTSPVNAVMCMFFQCSGGKLQVPCNGDSACPGCTSGWSILRYILPL
jgi:hypothetical protein